MKISKSKQELARIISENGGWCDGAESAAQCKSDNAVSFYRDAPDRDGDCWWGEHLDGRDISQEKLIANWPQTILSRAEYVHLYPAPDADGWIEWKGGECPVGAKDIIDVKLRDGEVYLDRDSSWTWRHYDCEGDIIAYRMHRPEQVEPEFCEAVMRSIPEPSDKPTIEQLASDYRNAKDYAERKQKDADDAKADADEKLRALEIAGEAIGLLVSPITEKQEPELAAVVKVGDEVECVESNIKRDKYNGMVGRLHTIDESDTSTPYLVDFGGNAKIWCHEVKFIRRQ